MKIRNLVATLLTMTLSLGAFQAAIAVPPGPPDPDPGEPPCNLNVPPHDDHACRAQLNGLFLTIGGADSVNLRDESKLQSKVCAADEKLHVTPSPKTGDAIQKLADIIETVNSKKKISVADAAAIEAEAVLAQICVGSI